jgi:hypothetical protein
MAFLSAQSRQRQWRARSRICAAIDIAVVAAGAAVCALAAADVISTWLASRAWLDHQHLSVVMGAILIPTWPWMIASQLLMSPVRKRPYAWWREPDRVADARRAEARMLRHNMYPGWRAWLAPLVIGVLCVALVVAGLASGGAKGSGYVLSGPHYRIQTSGLNGGGWSDVTAAQYAYWQARFVRLDAFFALFGWIMIFLSFGVLQLHRTATAGARVQPTAAGSANRRGDSNP